MNRRVLLASALAATALAAWAVFGAPLSSTALQVDDGTVARLQALRQEPKFLDLPGRPAAAERRRLEPLIDDLLDRLVAGIRSHPVDTWVLDQMDPTVDAFHLEDTEARERCLDYLQRIFAIVGMPGDRGAFRKYLIF